MEFLILLILGGIIWAAIAFVLWLAKPDSGSNSSIGAASPDDDIDDPDWEDHIRHDPFHPGGSGGFGHHG